ncbi:tRNA (adenosine(37)-N6)-threonylcarbamoyltransferase complex dimerization subunit type 1 TsaB [Hydrogenovibrio sp. JE_KL2]|uniref:tRNA (adenosine(37)-N6)-threonylcarbamoyltransferase complex dimerization subunit type 1 TsaB n=1 Tax=Hydrogenovibrio sp. JE_KL2 TaxID=2651188 RepID=UPI00128B2AF6|nr:tRNA (adenosine(37)-N6)-threonylcarbamoyltransferase complex dimerization subunit type 1 TsaB [Hydrogenovibrio sp. JE_KL2]MPQ76056.1 tRNA (adenosine(37)-N6)-threonylcarbamoyltransferase complex dimerization subunit type 1 TsaB [Hydrogenovibrio sp. JE_KL2]
MTKAIEPKILAIDTSTQACSVSLEYDSTSYTEFAMTPQTHANHVLQMVDSVLERAGVEGNDLDCLALSEGPGAFTGIRIAAGVVQGLAFGWNKPVISISTLEAVAWPMLSNHSNSKVAACLDARMRELYLQICYLQDGKMTSEPAQLLSEADALVKIQSENVLLGTGDITTEFSELVAKFDQWEERLPSAEAVVDIAKQRVPSAKSVLDSVPLPVYLRNNVAEKPK